MPPRGRLCPAKLTSKLIVFGVSLALVLLVLIIWQPKKSHKSTLDDERSRLANNGRVSIIEADDDSGLPRMYKDFFEDPNKFRDSYKQPPFEIPVSNSEKGRTKKEKGGKKSKQRKTSRIDCIINDDRKVPCLMRESEVYLPFNKFLRKYFEVYGEVETTDGSDKKVFQFHHSSAPLWPPVAPYKPDGEFLFFKMYDVDSRSKVELISGIYGVPVSNQWDRDGYIYPIQVAQYGLSHYSKYIAPNGAKDDRRTIIDDGDQTVFKWNAPKDSILQYKVDSMTNNPAVYFNTTSSGSLPQLTIDEERLDLCLSFDVRFVAPGSSVSVVMDASDGQYVITYVQGNFYKKTGEDNMQYGIGECAAWCHLHRDVMVDIKKFLPDKSKWKALRNSLQSIQHIEVKGEGWLDNITLSNTCHLSHFKAASDWVLNNQDKNGGWQVSVTRVITTKKLTLNPGWYSAMAQGQCISLLMRAYTIYKKPEYLKAAEKALNIYQNLSSYGGVKAIFLEKYDWYEEYPTQPPLFVLNGFIYSLFGLYDLARLGNNPAKSLAQVLFDRGLVSLKAMLPLFDSGRGTFYDLRHVTMIGMAPNRARWDYHAVHIAQLMNLAYIDNSTIFNATATRWIGYTEGIWSPHN